jgi:hypothetical protein
MTGGLASYAGLRFGRELAEQAGHPNTVDVSEVKLPVMPDRNRGISSHYRDASDGAAGRPRNFRLPWGLGT